MKKLITIGCPDSGKSTFSRVLAEKTELPLRHLDKLYRDPDRTTVEKPAFHARLAEVMSGDAWIIDVNHGFTCLSASLIATCLHDTKHGGLRTNLSKCIQEIWINPRVKCRGAFFV